MTEKTGSSPLEAITRVVELLTEQYEGTMPSIRMVDAAASSAKFPVTRINGRRYVARGDFSKVAAVFGLTPKAVPAKAARKAPAAPASAAA